eukprot:6203026-Amphidinium_carterae.2
MSLQTHHADQIVFTTDSATQRYAIFWHGSYFVATILLFGIVLPPCSSPTLLCHLACCALLFRSGSLKFPRWSSARFELPVVAPSD